MSTSQSLCPCSACHIFLCSSSENGLQMSQASSACIALSPDNGLFTNEYNSANVFPGDEGGTPSFLENTFWKWHPSGNPSSTDYDRCFTSTSCGAKYPAATPLSILAKLESHFDSTDAGIAFMWSSAAGVWRSQTASLKSFTLPMYKNSKARCILPSLSAANKQKLLIAIRPQQSCIVRGSLHLTIQSFHTVFEGRQVLKQNGNDS